jgi:hypothetical protein
MSRPVISTNCEAYNTQQDPDCLAWETTNFEAFSGEFAAAYGFTRLPHFISFPIELSSADRKPQNATKIGKTDLKVSSNDSGACSSVDSSLKSTEFCSRSMIVPKL